MRLSDVPVQLPGEPKHRLVIKTDRKVRRPLTRRAKITLAGCGAAAFLLFCLVAIGTGYAGQVVNIYPMVTAGSKTTTLKCDYAGRDLSVSAHLYTNVDNYYHYNGHKRNLVEQGDLSKYVYTNPQDDTIKALADQIRQIGQTENLNDDQLVELTTCFIQNIPYNDARATQVLSGGNESYSEQYPYETLYKNSGICTDKTYLGAALLRELGYGTAIFVFPEDQHVALALSAPNGYTEFDSQYTMMELTTPGFAPGELPTGIDDNNGKPSAKIAKISDLTPSDNPADLKIGKTADIDAPTLVIKVNDGKQYTRIIAVKSLENKIYANLDSLSGRRSVLESAYNELNRRDQAQKSAYNAYVYTPSTKLDCGYKYDYSYSYLYSSPYSYSSPYTYRCDTISNPQKSYLYLSYTSALGSYNNQVAFYNGLVDNFNAQLATTKQDIQSYKGYQYN